MKNFERRMLEEKGLLYHTLEFEVEGLKHSMPVGVVVEFIENLPSEIRNTIKNQFSKIDFLNGDLLDYVTFLAKGIVHL